MNGEQPNPKVGDRFTTSGQTFTVTAVTPTYVAIVKDGETIVRLVPDMSAFEWVNP